jgi:hypothetical protein
MRDVPALFLPPPLRVFLDTSQVSLFCPAIRILAAAIASFVIFSADSIRAISCSRSCSFKVATVV